LTFEDINSALYGFGLVKQVFKLELHGVPWFAGV